MSTLTRLSPVGPITFRRRALEPPTALRVGPDDEILFGVRAIPVVTISFRARIQRPDGRIVIYESTHVVTTETDFTQRFRLGDGFLLSCAISTTTPALASGACFAWVHMISSSAPDTTVSRVLIEDYITTAHAGGWPESDIHEPGSGNGLLSTVSPNPPGAGSEIAIGNLPVRRMQIRHMAAQFATDATVANRLVSFVVAVGGDILFIVRAGSVQTASQTVIYVLTPGAGDYVTRADVAHLPIPPRLFLGTAHVLISSTNGIQPGDVWGPIRLSAEFWVIPDL